ncbi:TPA: hypothetical protein HA235_00080 [Candidatus Woesearchaeota archaeon]|nr:hypothetical protein [Candidatus Woesearchaeota archaeon]HIH31082.1 hypothetical protein [Candidatus Woesearchaeota archaeon]HIH55290.1 hypothetical protein [Candidatus Woesearchaeota archaeon]HIJ01533.1 hypothetical protein [Candidatus Woesearchaeota archaeon]HIJ13837.1 hypothetical protein [Candidatus Woesearchaeota archaeon]
MRYELDYNRLHQAEMYEWNDDWSIDKYGNFIMKDDERIPMESIRFN